MVESNATESIRWNNESVVKYSRKSERSVETIVVTTVTVSERTNSYRVVKDNVTKSLRSNNMRELLKNLVSLRGE